MTLVTANAYHHTDVVPIERLADGSIRLELRSVRAEAMSLAATAVIAFGLLSLLGFVFLIGEVAVTVAVTTAVITVLVIWYSWRRTCRIELSPDGKLKFSTLAITKTFPLAELSDVKIDRTLFRSPDYWNVNVAYVAYARSRAVFRFTNGTAVNLGYLSEAEFRNVLLLAQTLKDHSDSVEILVLTDFQTDSGGSP
jgi:hypothetical protein